MIRRLLTAAVLLLLPIAAGAQRPNLGNMTGTEEPDTTQSQEPQGIIFESDGEADSLMPGYVYAFPPSTRDVKIRRIEHPTLDPAGVAMHNAVHRMDGDYRLDRGALGLTQLSAIPFNESTSRLLDCRRGLKPLTMHQQPDPNPVYRQGLHANRMFQTLRPYTMLRYGSSLNKDYQIGVVHTQNIQPRWNFAFLYDLVSRDGLYTNSDVTDHVVDLTTNYYSEDARYQLQASVRMNRLRQQENGGVQNDTSCWNTSRREGVPVNMYAAQNQWRDLEISLHQSYNTVRQFEKARPIVRQIRDTIATGVDSASADSSTRAFTVQTRDTVVGHDTLRVRQPHVYNTGVFALDLNFARRRRIFYDSQADSWFYNYTTLDTTFYYDSTTHYQFSGELYWTNDAYMQHRWRNPMVLTAGLRPEVNRLQYAGQHYGEASVHEFTVSPFARATFELKRFVLTASAEEVTGGERNGDYRLTGNISIAAGARGQIELAATSEAQAPDLMYRHNEGCYSWDIGNFRKIKRQQVAAAYTVVPADDSTGGGSHLVEMHTHASATLLTDNVWLNSSMTPTQGNATGLLAQATAAAHLRFGWLNIRLQETVQHSNDEAVVRVPLLASKNSMYADMYLFHRALRMQTGVDLRFHSRYKADGWNPVLGAFYRQDDVEVGGYLVADFWVSLQVKRASIYLKASHFNAPIGDLLGQTPSYFSLPHYPMEDFGLYWGVIWKFFN